MISQESLNALNATRVNALADADVRRLTASSRSGNSFAKGDVLNPVAGLLPDLLPIGNAANPNGWYLGYTLDNDRGTLSYKALFGKRVYAVLPESSKKEGAGMTFRDASDVDHEVVLIKREDFKPRCTASLAVEQKEANGKLFPVFKQGAKVTVDVIPSAFITCMPAGEDRHPDGKYYAYEVKNFAIFK